MPNKSTKPVLETDIQQDVLSSLEHFLVSLNFARTNPRHWKWAIISLHSAMQGAFACHVFSTANVEAFDKKRMALWWDFLNAGQSAGKEMPIERMASPRELLKRVMGVSTDTAPYGGVIAVDDETVRAFSLIDGLRQDFIHFKPQTWLIYLDGFPQKATLLLTLLETIVDKGWAFRFMEGLDDMRAVLDELKLTLKGW